MNIAFFKRHILHSIMTKKLRLSDFGDGSEPNYTKVLTVKLLLIYNER
jgi:hypothetical protein